MIDHRETPALWDCETLTPIQTNEQILTQFWDGFERLDRKKMLISYFPFRSEVKIQSFRRFTNLYLRSERINRQKVQKQRENLCFF